MFICLRFKPSILNYRLLKVLQLCCLQDIYYLHTRKLICQFSRRFGSISLHASQWLSPKNIALSEHAEVPPYAVDAVKEKAFPKNVDIQQALLKRKQLRDFHTEESKFSPCIACFSSSIFWKSIDNNNRSTERFIGRLKLIVNGMVRDDLQNFDKTDLSILATLHNVA